MYIVFELNGTGVTLNTLKVNSSDRIIEIDHHYLYFGGTAYLGLPANTEFKKHSG
jgi:hypothetical protein